MELASAAPNGNTLASLKGRALQLNSTMAALSLKNTPMLLGLTRGSGQDRQQILFDACRNGDVEQVKALMTPQNVNSRDLSGRKSTPLHFAAGKASYLSLSLPPLSGIVEITVCVIIVQALGDETSLNIYWKWVPK